jgi:metallo-beta-lactamase class B
MLNKLLAGTALTVLAATLALAQTPPAAQGGGRAGRGAGAAAGGGGGGQQITPEMWNKPEVQAYVAKAKAEAGNDPDLQYDVVYNCGVAQGLPRSGDQRGDGAYLQNSDPKIPYVAMTEQGANETTLPPQHIFDNLWRFGGGGVGAWLVTSNDGYILFDTLNNADEARDLIVGGMRKVGLDPTKVKYLVIGHYHLDHTGGAHYIEQTLHPRIYMGRDDWPLYFNSMKGADTRLTDKVPMARGQDVEDGMKLTVGDTTATVIQMTGHTPGSSGMIFPAKYNGRTFNVLITTASAGGTNIRNRETFIGGFEHIWNWAIKEKVESVLNAHLNYNINTLSRIMYVNNNYPPAKNPMIYGVEKTRKYIEITRACGQARLEALGW